MKNFVMASAMLMVLFGQGVSAHADLHVNAANDESRVEYAAKLKDRSAPGLVLMAAVNVGDVLLACPLDAVEVAGTAIADTLPIVSVFGALYGEAKFELAHNRNFEKKHPWEFPGSHGDLPVVSGDFGYVDLLVFASSERGNGRDPKMAGPLPAGSALSLVVAGGADLVRNAWQLVMNRHPQYTGARASGTIARRSYLTTEAEYLLSFKNDQSHCRGSIRKIGQIGHELGSGRDEDRAAAKSLAASSTSATNPQASAPGVRATN